MIEKIAPLIIGSSFGQRLSSHPLWIVLREIFFSLVYGLELVIRYPFSWYGIYVVLLAIVIILAYFLKKYQQKLLSSLKISQIFLWISFFIFSKIELFEGFAFNFNKNWWVPIGIPFMKSCSWCGSDVPPLWTFPYFLANRCLFFFLSYILVLFLPKKILNSKIRQWSIGIFSFSLVFVGIGWLGILYD